MAKDKQIQELEIHVSVNGDKAAESKIDRLLSKKERLDKANFDAIKVEKKEALRSSRLRKKKIEDTLKLDAINSRARTKSRSESLKDIRIRKAEESRIGREGIKLSRRRYKISKQYSMFTTGKDSKRKAVEERVLKNLIDTESKRGSNKYTYDRPVTGQNSALALDQLNRVEKLKETIKGRLGSGTGGFSNIDKAREKILAKERVMSNIASSRSLRGTGVNRFNNVVTEQNSALGKKYAGTILGRYAQKRIDIEKKLGKATKETNKPLKERVKIEKRVSKSTKESNKSASKHGAGRRSGGGFVGSAMLYLGAATMAQYMVGSAVGATFALGDIASTVESDVLKGQAFRKRYSEKNDVREFDTAVDLYSNLSGQSRYLAQSQMAQIAGSLEAAGVNLKGDQLTGIARATRGLSGGMGISEDMASQKILGLLSGRISAQEAGLVGVKRSSDPSKTLESILKFMEKNAVTASVMKEGTMSSLMARIRTAPLGLIASLSEQMPEQMKHGVEVFADWVDGFFGTGDDEVTDAWKRTMKQFEEMSVQVFGDGAGDMSIGIAKAVAAGIKTIELAARGTKNTVDVINDTIELAETLIDTRIIESGGTKTADRVIVDMISEPVDNFLAMIGKGGRELGGQSIDFMGRSINEGNDALDDYFKSKLKGLIHNPEQVEGGDEFGIKAGGQTINYNIGTAVIGENHELSLDHDIMSEGGVN